MNREAREPMAQASDYLPVILMGNEAMFEVADSVAAAEACGALPRMTYRTPTPRERAGNDADARTQRRFA